MKKNAWIILGALTAGLMLASCSPVPVPENASPFWSLRDGVYFSLQEPEEKETATTYVEAKFEKHDTRKSGAMALSVPFEYEHTFGGNKAFILIRIDRIRELTMGIVGTGLGRERLEDGTYVPSKYESVEYCTFMQATVLEVFRNSELTDFEPGDSIMIYTDWRYSDYEGNLHAAQYQEGSCFYIVPGILWSSENSYMVYQMIDELADYYVTFSNRNNFELTDKGTVLVPRCIWEGKGFEDLREPYYPIEVPQEEFEEFYKKMIEQYTDPTRNPLYD